jgi:hypothetical protein
MEAGSGACPSGLIVQTEGVRVLGAVVVVILALSVESVGETASRDGDGSVSMTVRRCGTGVLVSAAQLESALHKGDARRVGRLVYTSLAWVPPQLMPIGLLRPGRYSSVKWAIGAVGSDPLRVIVHGRARMDLGWSPKADGLGVPLSATETVADLFPCSSAATLFYGGMVQLEPPPFCVSLSAVDLRTGERWSTEVGVDRRC